MADELEAEIGVLLARVGSATPPTSSSSSDVDAAAEIKKLLDEERSQKTAIENEKELLKNKISQLENQLTKSSGNEPNTFFSIVPNN